MKIFSLYLMALLYIAAGINHFWHPETYLRIIPSFLPLHKVINIVIGVIEIILGLLLLCRPVRSKAAWGIVILLIVVFPANIQMAMNYKDAGFPELWLAYLRLPLQVILIWWALWYTKPAGSVDIYNKT